MNLPSIIDVALGLSLIFFILASIGSVLAEFWAAHQKLRHRLLRKTINRLLGPDIAARFWRHSLVLPLYEPPLEDEVEEADSVGHEIWDKTKYYIGTALSKSKKLAANMPRWLAKGRPAIAPAYLDTQLFATVVLDIASGQGVLGPIPNDRASWEATIKASIAEIIGDNNDLQDHLLALLRQIPVNNPDTAAALKEAVSKWYDEAMQRASGTYRRQTQRFLLLFGAILAVALNVDAVRIAQILYLNPELRSAVAAQAEAMIKDTGAETSSSAVAKSETTISGQAAPAAKTAPDASTASSTSPNSAPNPTPTSPTSAPSPTPREQLREATGQLRDLAKIGFPLGWMPEWQSNFIHTEKSSEGWLAARVWREFGRYVLSNFKPGWFCSTLTWGYAKVDTLLSTGWFALLAKFAGLAATALAVCLGAPFWFDVMGRLVKLRSSAGSDAEKSKSSSTANAGASPTGSNPPPNTGLAPASVGSSASTPAALAIAKPLPLATAAIAPVVHPSHVVARAYWLAEFADHAYETNPTLLAIWLQQHGFTVKQCFSDPKTDTQGFLAVAGSVAVLSFRGTEKKLSDWLTDANADQIADPAGIVPGGLHQGFITAFNSVAAAVDAELDALKAAGATLHITGHSLGAALATLAALHCEGRAKSAGLVSSVHTFGSPRVGDTVFAAAFERALRNRAFRFVNNEDLVTRVPPPDLPFGAKTLRYEHVGEMKFIDPQGKLMGEVSFMFRLLNFTTNALGDMKQAVATTVKDHSMALYCAHLRNNF